MNYQFEEPGTSQGDRFSAEQAQNRRLIVVPVEYIPMMQVSGGRETDAIKLNVVDLQGGFNPMTGTEDAPGTVYMGCLWFGGRLIGAFRNSLGKLFVGYVGKERTSGGFQAWQFYSLTQDQQTTGMATVWLEANPTFMETCKHDVQTGQTQWMHQPPGQPQQPTTAPWNPATQHGPSPIPQQPSPPQPGPAPMPVQPPLPPPMSAPPSQVGSLNPEYQAYQASAATQQSAPPAPQSPAPTQPPPVNQTVMERLRAQREQGQEQPQGNMPY